MTSETDGSWQCEYMIINDMRYLNVMFKKKKSALLTQTMFQWMKYIRGWQLISQQQSSSAGSQGWAERGWTVVTETGSVWGSMGLRIDRMESVNQRGPWWPKHTADLPELVARWWEHRHLSPVDAHVTQTPHPWRMENSPFVNGTVTADCSTQQRGENLQHAGVFQT